MASDYDKKQWQDEQAARDIALERQRAKFRILKVSLARALSSASISSAPRFTTEKRAGQGRL